MIYVELIGYVATTLSIISFVPQFMKSWKTKSTKDVSFQMYFIFTVSQVLWLVYGTLIHSWPLAIANAIIFSLSLAILILKIKHGLVLNFLFPIKKYHNNNSLTDWFLFTRYIVFAMSGAVLMTSIQGLVARSGCS